MLRHLFFSAVLLSAGTTLLSQSSTPIVSFEFARTSISLSNSSQTVAPVQGDFNRDGKPDFVIAATNDAGTSVSLVLGKGDGTFQQPLPVGNGNGPIQDLAVADIDDDGKLDVVTFDINNDFSVFYGNGDGTFQKPMVFATSAYPVSGTVGHFFDDGFTDIAIADNNGDIEVFRNEGGKNFVLISTIQSPSPNITSTSFYRVHSGEGFYHLRAGNINGTGSSDIGAITTTAAYVLWNNGQGSFRPVLLSNYQFPEDVTIGNVNQDGRADIIVSYSCYDAPFSGRNNPSSCVGLDIFYGQGNDQTFFRNAVRQSGPSAVYSVNAVDVTGDGIADLVAPGSVPGSQNEGLYVWAGNSDGSFNQVAQVFQTGSTGLLVAGDFNRDGAIDFILSSYGGALETFINASQRGLCQASAISPTVRVCQPVDNTYVQPVISVRATAYDKNKTTALQEYVDGNLDYSEDVSVFDYTSPALSLGSHSLVTKAWDNTGLEFISPRTVTVYRGTPGLTCPAAVGTASICMPSTPITSSPVQILANGSTSNLPTGTQLYIDGKLVVNETGGCQPGYCFSGTSFVQTTQNLSVGSHQLVFKLWDAQGNVYTAQKSIIVR